MASEQAPTPRLPLRGPGSGAAAVRGGEAAGAAGWGRGMWPCLLGGCQGKAVAVQPSPFPSHQPGKRMGQNQEPVPQPCCGSAPARSLGEITPARKVLPRFCLRGWLFRAPRVAHGSPIRACVLRWLPAGTATDGDSGEGHSDGRCLGVGPGRWALGFQQRLRPQRVSTEGQYLPGLMAESACVWFLCCEMNGLLC